MPDVPWGAVHTEQLFEAPPVPQLFEAPPAPPPGPSEDAGNRDELRQRVIDELLAAGFQFSGSLLSLPPGDLKAVARQLYEPQRQAVLEEAREFIISREADL